MDPDKKNVKWNDVDVQYMWNLVQIQIKIRI